MLIPSVEHVGQLMLGRMIRTLRKSRGLTQLDFAQVAVMTQSHVSKVENANVAITEDQVRHIARVLEASEQELAELLFQFRLTEQNPLSYHVITAHGVDIKQLEISRYEGAARLIEQYEPTIIPGLLQTPDYILGMMRAFEVPRSQVEEAIQARLARQRILTRADKTFHFIISEAALYTAPEGPRMQAEQLEALLIHFGRKNTRIGVLPTRRGALPTAMSGFVVFDRSFATAETAVEEQQIREPLDVRHLSEIHNQLAARAEYADSAIVCIRDAIEELSATFHP